MVPPAPDQCEVSLFGPGFGECLCLHLGDGAWVVVDSCVDPGDSLPAALRYLTRLGLDPADAVELLIVTHWHDDHIRGVAEILEACPKAQVACSAAVRRPDSLAFVQTQRLAGAASARVLMNSQVSLTSPRVRGRRRYGQRPGSRCSLRASLRSRS